MRWWEKIALPISFSTWGCPPGWRLTRAASDGPDAGITRHLARCTHCSSEFRGLLSLGNQMGAAFPAPEKMGRESREAIAARLRNAAPEAQPRRQRWAPLWLAVPGVGLVLGLVLVGGIFGLKRWLVSRGPSRTETATLRDSRATIRAIGPARFSRAATPPDEVVNLDEGSIELEVAALHAGERFRVKTADGEVEVRGTSFKVSAAQRRLVAVHVWRGRVEVRSVDGALAVLDPGDDWVRGPGVVSAAAPAAAAPGTPASISQPASSPMGPPTSEAIPPGLSRPHPSGSHPHRAGSQVAVNKSGAAAGSLPPPPAGPSFSHAWGLLRQGNAHAAAAEFAGVQHLARGRDIEEDALYWRAVATGQAGDVAAARRLFDDFLERFPASPRAGEAAVAFGQLLVAAGDARAAREVFERAARDRSPQVRASAQQGLGRIAAGP